MRNRRLALLELAVPYFTIPIGLYGLHSAWAAIGFYHAGMLAVLLASGDLGRTAKLLGRGWRLRLGFLLGLGGLLVGPALVWTWPVIRTAIPDMSALLRPLGLNGWAWVLFVVHYGLVHPGIEEAYWRGHVAPGLARPWLSDVAFAGYHAVVLWPFIAWPAAVSCVVVLAVASALWRHVARSAGGLAIPWACHLAADASFVAGLVWLVRNAGR